MEPYIFYGKILPERAQISLSFGLKFSHLTSSDVGEVQVNIILNQLSAVVHVDKEWNIFDLRNVVKSLVQNYLAMLGYLKGYAYDLEITRVINSKLASDYVFGIDIPVIAKPRESINLSEELHKLRIKTQGKEGVFLNRCFNDLVSAMKFADDTGFYCYRAIESLRQHCAATHGLSEKKDKVQWEKFREVSKIDEITVRKLENAAGILRHGGVSSVTDDERQELFKDTWHIVESYLASI